MTTITIYPFQSNMIIGNLIYYATQSGFTVTSYSGPNSDYNTNTVYFQIVISQVLSGAQQTAIQNIFNGSAYIKFT